MNDNKTIEILSKVTNYIEDIELIMRNHEYDYEEYISNVEFKHSVNMCLLQIGELAKHLDRDLIREHADAGWREAIGLRNVVAHGYGSLRDTLMWKTLTHDIPRLKEDIESIVQEYMKQEAEREFEIEK